MNAVKDSIIYLSGEIIAKAMPFLLLPYLSRKLGVEGFGELSYYQTFIALFFLVINLSQDGAIMRYFYFYGKRSLNLVVLTGYAWSVAVSGVMLVFCLWFNANILAYCVLAALFQSFVSVQLSIRQCQKQALSYTQIQCLSGLFTLILTVSFLEFFDTDLIEKRIIAVLLTHLFVFLIAYTIYRNAFRFRRFSIAQYQRAGLYLFSFGLPLILHNVSYFLKGQLDRIFIYHQFSEFELGLYAMGAQVAMILMVLLQAVNKATVPYYFEALKQKKITLQQVHRLAGYTLFIVPLPALIVWFVPENWILWILGERFHGVKYYIGAFLISNALIIPYFILVNYLFYYGKNQAIAFCSLLSTVIYVITLTLLIQTDIAYVPLASILGSIVIIPILFLITHQVSKKQ